MRVAVAALGAAAAGGAAYMVYQRSMQSHAEAPKAAAPKAAGKVLGGLLVMAGLAVTASAQRTATEKHSLLASSVERGSEDGSTAVEGKDGGLDLEMVDMDHTEAAERDDRALQRRLPAHHLLDPVSHEPLLRDRQVAALTLEVEHVFAQPAQLELVLAADEGSPMHAAGAREANPAADAATRPAGGVGALGAHRQPPNLHLERPRRVHPPQQPAAHAAQPLAGEH